MTIRPPQSVTEWALAIAFASLTISFASIALSVLNFVLAELRRRENTSIKLNPNYRLKLPRDRYRYFSCLGEGQPSEGDPAIHISVRYHGRHSCEVRAAGYERGSEPHRTVQNFTPKTLYDGQRYDFLIYDPPEELHKATAVIVNTVDRLWGIPIRFKRTRIHGSRRAQKHYES